MLLCTWALPMNVLRSVFLLGVLSSSHAQETPGFFAALLHGKANLDSRPRLENVADDAFVEHAQALTWRNRL